MKIFNFVRYEHYEHSVIYDIEAETFEEAIEMADSGKAQPVSSKYVRTVQNGVARLISEKEVIGDMEIPITISLTKAERVAIEEMYGVDGTDQKAMKGILEEKLAIYLESLQ